MMHLPLKVIMILWSVSFVLIYFLVYLVIVYVFKNEEIALGVPLVLMLGIKSSYFWISTETHQAMVYSVLLFAFLHYSLNMKPRYRSTLVTLIGGLVILILCFFSHPVSFFTVMFILGFFMINKKLWKSPVIYALGIMIILITLTKVFTVPEKGYESNSFTDFFNSYTVIPHLGSSQSFSFF